MSAAERLSKLEALLSRIQQRRHDPRPLRVAEVVASEDEPDVDLELATLPPDEVVTASEPAVAPRQDTPEESFGDLRSSAPPAEQEKAPGAPSAFTAAAEQLDAPPTAVTNGAGSYPPPASGPTEQEPSGTPAASAREPERAPEAAGESSPAAAERPRAITLPDAPPVQVLTEPTEKHGHVVPQASGPVAQTEGERPSPPADGFEALIARSLALRPR